MGNAPAMLLELRTFQFAVSSVSPGQAFSSSCFLPAGQCGLRKRQTGKATWSAAIGWTQACSEWASSSGQQPARLDRVAPLRIGLPFRVYANFSVCGLNSILVDPVGFVPGQTSQSIAGVGFVRQRRAGWVLSAALGGFQNQYRTTTVFMVSKRQYRSFHV